MRHLHSAVVLFFLTFSACTRMNSQQNAINKKLSPEVIYGIDTRLDFYAVTDPYLRRVAESTVALVDHRKLTENGDPLFYNLQSSEYGKTYYLCEDEPFFSQPSSAFCSGFLIGPELIVTAGHCIRNVVNCENVRFVFGFHYTTADKDLSQIPKENVYRCADLIHSETNAITGRDFALIRTDRPVTGFAPMSVRKLGVVPSEDELTVIGHPKGLPAKIAAEGKIRDNNPTHFLVATLDTYGGNSGSAVINSLSHSVEGILVNGEDDFEYDPVKKCRRSKVCAETECRGEDVVRIGVIFDYLTPSDLQPFRSPFDLSIDSQ